MQTGRDIEIYQKNRDFHTACLYFQFVSIVIDCKFIDGDGAGKP